MKAKSRDMPLSATREWASLMFCGPSSEGEVRPQMALSLRVVIECGEEFGGARLRVHGGCSLSLGNEMAELHCNEWSRASLAIAQSYCWVAISEDWECGPVVLLRSRWRCRRVGGGAEVL